MARLKRKEDNTVDIVEVVRDLVYKKMRELYDVQREVQELKEELEELKERIEELETRVYELEETGGGVGG